MDSYIFCTLFVIFRFLFLNFAGSISLAEARYGLCGWVLTFYRKAFTYALS